MVVAAVPATGVEHAATAPVLLRISPGVTRSIITPVHVAPGPGIQPMILQPPPTSLPLLGSLSGSLLKDRVDPSRTWYLPVLQLRPDPDLAFGFAAAQVGVDANGDPANRLQLTLGLVRQAAPDAAALLAKQPRPSVTEVPVTFGAPTLNIVVKDPNTGADQHIALVGTIVPAADGSLTATFDNVLGKNVVLLFENLRAGGSAVLSVSAFYEVWRELSRSLPVTSNGVFRPVMASTLHSTADGYPIGPKQAQSLRPLVISRPPPTWTQPIWVRTTKAVGYSLPLALKYATEVYLAKYTLTSGATTRPIISVDDLRDFNADQSEYRELHELGAVTARYPSIARLYIGVLSRTIVAIPAHYAILCNGESCAASCQLLVDSASGGARFQFQFLVAPAVSPIELAQLSAEIGGSPDLKDCTLTMPQFLRQPGACTLATAFASSASFGPGSSPGCFALSLQVTDADPNVPAIASGNMLIRQLCVGQPPYLSGILDLRLDDTLPDPIQVPIVLNFNATSGTGGLTVAVDETEKRINLLNRSTFDMHLRRYALCLGETVTVIPSDQVVKSGATQSEPLPANHAGLTVLLDQDVVFAGGDTMDQLSRYLDVQVQDVESIRCTLGINAGGVSFARHGIAQIVATIGFSGLPQLAPLTLTLTAAAPIASAPLALPLQALIGSLPATVQLSTRHQDASKPPTISVVSVDFLQSPLFVVSDAMLGA